MRAGVEQGAVNIMAKRKSMSGVWLLVFGLLAGPHFSPATAQMAQPQEVFIEPVTSAVAQPFLEFLKRLGLKDPTQTMSRTRFHSFGPNSFGFRIEDKDIGACWEDSCLNVLGRVDDNRFVAEAMVFAGAKATRLDVGRPFLGALTFPLILDGSHSAVLLMETPAGWAVAPFAK